VGVSSQLEGGRFSFGARGLARNTSELGFSGGFGAYVLVCVFRHSGTCAMTAKHMARRTNGLNGKSNQG
jgi:hypothetical protein